MLRARIGNQVEIAIRRASEDLDDIEYAVAIAVDFAGVDDAVVVEVEVVAPPWIVACAYDSAVE